MVMLAIWLFLTPYQSPRQVESKGMQWGHTTFQWLYGSGKQMPANIGKAIEGIKLLGQLLRGMKVEIWLPRFSKSSSISPVPDVGIDGNMEYPSFQGSDSEADAVRMENV